MTSQLCPIVIATLDWRGILIEVRYHVDWPDSDEAHITLESIKPLRAALPVTTTGYRSHFADPEDVEEAGGPLAYVAAWLNEAARDRRWIAAGEARRQRSLF